MFGTQPVEAANEDHQIYTAGETKIIELLERIAKATEKKASGRPFGSRNQTGQTAILNSPETYAFIGKFIISKRDLGYDSLTTKEIARYLRKQGLNIKWGIRKVLLENAEALRVSPVGKSPFVWKIK